MIILRRYGGTRCAAETGYPPYWSRPPGASSRVCRNAAPVEAPTRPGAAKKFWW